MLMRQSVPAVVYVIMLGLKHLSVDDIHGAAQLFSTVL